MATIKKTDIVSNFNTYVKSTANTGIVWYANNKPFTDFDSGTYLTGTIAGMTSNLDTTDLPGSTINALDIYNALLTETNRYTSIRKMRARLNVTGNGNTYTTGSSSPANCTKGIIYDETEKAYMPDGYNTSVISSVSKHGTTAGSKIYDGAGAEDGLDDLYSAMKTAYIAKHDIVYTVTVSVCHCSCHSNCHGSRGRR